MGWFYSATPQMKLVIPEHEQNRHPAPRHPAPHRQSSQYQAARKAARTSLQVINEFRSKMRVAEEMITKLTFSLREIQGLRKRQRPKLTSASANNTSNTKQSANPSALIIQVNSDRFVSKAKP
jgi:hypothetical protein